MMKAWTLFALAAAALAGCSGGSESHVTADEEKMFKNPGPVDRSKIPSNAFEHAGPSYIGKPSAGSGAGSAPPPAATTGG